MQVHDIQEGAITIGCDGKQALRAVFDEWDPEPHRKDFDIIHELRQIRKKLPIRTVPHWVKGHQDDDKNKILDVWAKINIEMDLRAKRHLKSQTIASIPNLHFGKEPISFWLGNTKLTRFDVPYLYDEIVGRKLAAYWGRKHDIPAHLLDAINWEQQGIALKNWHNGSHRWFIKFATGFFGVGKMMKRRGEQDHAKCPRCDIEGEDNRHVIQCQDPKARLLWKAEMDRLQRWMVEKKTDPTLQVAILAKMQAWQTGLAGYHYRGSRELELAIQEQDQIGWWNFMLGRVSKKITSLQDQYYDRINSKFTGATWTRRLIKEIWKVSWNMWEQRNDRLHKGDTPENTRIVLRLHREIQEELAKGRSGLQKKDRHLIGPDTKDWIFAETIPVMEEWLGAVRTSRRIETDNQVARERQLDLQREFIRNFCAGRSNSHLNTTPRIISPEQGSTTRETNTLEHEILEDEETEEEDWYEDFQPDWDPLGEGENTPGNIATVGAPLPSDSSDAEDTEDSQQEWQYEGIIGHRKSGGQYWVRVKWTATDTAWAPTWEPLAQFAEDGADECKKYATENDLLEEWSEYF